MNVGPRRLLSDDRGVNTTVAHALTLAITAILIVGLITAATSFFQTEREQVAREELQTIGNRLASETMQVSRLDTPGGGTTIISDHPDFVAGVRYQAEILTGSDCQSNDITTHTCIQLETSSLDVAVEIPIQNESGVTIESLGGGKFEVQTLNTGGPVRTASADRISEFDLGSQVGVGAGVRRISSFSLTSPGNQPPVASFTITPATPDAGTEVTFDASASRDPDGTIQEYRWDFDDDGTFENVTATPMFNRTLSGGEHTVTLEVWDGAAKSNFTRSIDIAGLTYLDDLDTFSGDDTATLSFRNDYSQTIELRQFLIDPADDSLAELNETTASHEVEITGDSDSTYVEYYDGLSFSDGGEFLDLDTSGNENGGYLTLGDGEEVTVDLRYFSSGVESEELTFGFRYEVASLRNASVVTDTVSGIAIDDYRVVAAGQDVDVRFTSTVQLTNIEAQISGDASGTLTESDFTESGSGPYTYEADVSSGSDGTFSVELTTAEAGGTPSGETPITDTAVVGSPFTWTSSSDWNAVTVEDGSVVHANFGDHAADQIEVGYNRSGNGLVGYWPLDDPSNAPDESGTGNDGTINGDPTTTTGIGGSSAFKLDGSDDHVSVPDSPSLDMEDTDEVTVSMWVNKQATQSSWIAMFQHSDVSYNLHFSDGNEPYFTIWDPDDGEYPDAQGSSIENNRWYHLVGTFDADNGGFFSSEQIQLYVDGSREAEECQRSSGFFSGCDSGEIAPTNEPAGIGENVHKPGRHLDGKIDEIRVYDRELSANEVEGLYDVYTESSTFTTDFKTGSSLSAGSLQLFYDVEQNPSDTIRVKVLTESGDESDWITVGSDGSGLEQVTGLASGDDRFRLKVELTPGSEVSSPTVRELGVTG
jgi:hypothetical protein